MLDKEKYSLVYDMTDFATPLSGDCGELCSAACCQNSDDGDMGMYLLPGEEAMHDMDDPWLEWEADDAEDYDFPPSWNGRKVYFVHCHGPGSCRRSLRPIQCRTFPLMPHLTEEGKLEMRLSNEDLPYICPLASGQKNLEKSFVRTMKKAWEMLLEDDLIRDLVWMDSRNRDEDEE